MKHKKHSASAQTALIFMLVLQSFSSPAYAQDESDNDDEPTLDERILTSSTSTLDNMDTIALVSTAAILVTSTGGVITIFMLADRGARTNQIVLRHYILKERESLHAAHALGGGHAVDDLAAMLWVPAERRGLIGAAMRDERAALDALIAHPCQDAATCDALADRYITLLISALNAHPEAHRPITLSP